MKKVNFLENFDKKDREDSLRGLGNYKKYLQTFQKWGIRPTRTVPFDDSSICHNFCLKAP